MPFTWQPRATVMLVKKVWYLRGIYCSFAVRENLKNIATLKYSQWTKNWIYCTLLRVKSYVKYGIGFDFTFDARQKCRQIYNHFAYSFDLGKGAVKLLTILTSPLTRVKDEVK